MWRAARPGRRHHHRRVRLCDPYRSRATPTVSGATTTTTPRRCSRRTGRQPAGGNGAALEQRRQRRRSWCYTVRHGGSASFHRRRDRAARAERRSDDVARRAVPAHRAPGDRRDQARRGARDGRPRQDARRSPRHRARPRRGGRVPPCPPGRGRATRRSRSCRTASGEPRPRRRCGHPAAAVEFCVEELGIERIPRRHELRHRPPDDFHVVVIGSGVGGINAAINLQECGIPFTVLDKNDDVGGTWHDNTYPGCRVDVPSLAYSHSFGLRYPWDHWFAPQEENNRYLQWCVDAFGVRDHIRFSTEVTALTWQEQTATWLVDVKDADGNARQLRANAVISAVGFLSRPKFPTIKGMETFAGPAFHTTWWDHAFDEPAGKHLAVIGTGCSGMQLVPELERRGATVTVFQRRPSWIFEVPVYRAELPDGLKWLDRNMPYYRNFEKFRAVWMVGDHVAASPFMRDPSWADPDSLSQVNQRARQVSLDYLQ